MTKLELYELLSYHNKKYWIENSPEISDIEYDKLMQQYIFLGGSQEDFKIEGVLSDTNQKYIHKNPMLSLDKVYTFDELIIWINKVIRSENEEFIIQPKYDGWAGKFIKEQNLLITRGDGYKGEDISSKLPLIKIKINHQNIDNDYVIGEIIINKDTFNEHHNELKRKNGELYKTPRTCLTGILASDEIKQYSFKPLEFVDYSLYSHVLTAKEFNITYWERIINNIQNYFEYPCDGIVIKLKDLDYYNSLGNTAHHPRGAVAFKFGNPSGMTKLIDVKWYVGKNNTLNPVAILEPVNIAGHKITKANLHNAENILNLKIKINDTVIVERCGEIIPDIIKVIPGENRKDIIITSCPICNSKLDYNPPFLYCINPSCSGSIVKKLTDSCTRLGFKNIGPGTVEKFVNELKIETIDDVFTITKDEINELTGFAEISTNNLYNEINNIKNNKIEDYKILSSLNIRGIGIDISKLILKHFTIFELYDYDNLDYDKLSLIPGLGSIRIEDLITGLKDYHNILNNLLTIFNGKIIDSKNDNNCPKICFTGKMKNPRSYYETLAKEKGYDPTSTVNKDLAILVTSDLSRKSSKMVKAQKLGIKIITIQEFENL